MIDEYPILAVAAAFAEGTTRMRGLKELRVKESDRLAATADMLRANGVAVEIEGDDLIVHGKGRAPGGGDGRDPYGPPHRHGGAGDGARERASRSAVDDAAFIATSFPGFVELMRGLGRADRLRMIIAIDGPAASGKGTLASGSPLTSGCAISTPGCSTARSPRRCIDAGRAPDDRARAIAAAQALDPAQFDEKALQEPRGGRGRLDRRRRSPRCAPRCSTFQRDFAATPPGAVLDGRDIGTVIAPDADVKIFVIAAPEVRARRRALELNADGQPVDEAAVLADILRRDERDRSRAVAPLVPAPDAHLLDTTAGRRRAVAAAIEIVERARPRAGRAPCVRLRHQRVDAHNPLRGTADIAPGKYGPTARRHALAALRHLAIDAAVRAAIDIVEAARTG